MKQYGKAEHGRVVCLFWNFNMNAGKSKCVHLLHFYLIKGGKCALTPPKPLRVDM